MKFIGHASLLWLFLPHLLLADSWTTKGHDARRTGQSEIEGPESIATVDTYMVDEGVSINITATVDDAGVAYIGTWGIVRSYGSEDQTEWEKCDGKVYAVDSDGTASAWGQPFHPYQVPYCYYYQDRADPSYCPNGGAVSWYNGTVEGTAAISADGSTLYVGRGDGRVYALNTYSGELVWTFITFNPEDEEDPDGGGEVIGGPLLTPDGILYFSTVAAGPYETNAIYAVNASSGSLIWRYPADSARLPHVFWSAPVLSPDSARVYFAGSWGPTVDERDPLIAGTIYAFDARAVENPAAPPLAWTYIPTRDNELGEVNVYPFIMAAGSDGRLFIGGSEYTENWGTAVVFALDDAEDHAVMAWDDYVDVDRNQAAMVYGLALREENGITSRVYATSANGYSALGYSSGGYLLAVDSDSGSAQWTYDPDQHGMYGALTGIAIDSSGDLYTGVSGLGDSNGVVFSLSSSGDFRWKYTLGGLLEWGAPTLGPGGHVYVSDTRRCLWFFEPVEYGYCDGTNIDPRLYILRNEDASGCGSRCSSATQKPVRAVWMLLGAVFGWTLLLIRRRVHTD